MQVQRNPNEWSELGRVVNSTSFSSARYGGRELDLVFFLAVGRGRVHALRQKTTSTLN